MDRRLKFYGINDYGTFYQVKQSTACLDNYDDTKTDYDIDDVIELYNATQFVESDIFPRDLTSKKEAAYKALMPKIKKTVATFRIDRFHFIFNNAIFFIGQISYLKN